MIEDSFEGRLGFDETEIKALVLSLDMYKLSSPVVASEYRVGRGSTRADLVILGERLTSFEIKSDYDKLTRLKRQMESYSIHFDRSVLVVTTKHLELAAKDCPQHVEIWEVRSPGVIKQVREGRDSPNVSVRDRLSLLTKAERRKLLGCDDSKTLLECSETSIIEAVNAAFIKRHEASSIRFWNSAQRKRVDRNMLKQLSRFQAHRSVALAQNEAQQNFWADWNASAANFFSNV